MFDCTQQLLDVCIVNSHEGTASELGDSRPTTDITIVVWFFSIISVTSDIVVYDNPPDPTRTHPSCLAQPFNNSARP